MSSHLIYLVLLTLILGTALYVLRAHWLPLVQSSAPYLYSRLPSTSSHSADINTFEGDIESGLSSSNFDLAGNVASGDSRGGLDDVAKREILTIMKKRRLKFDEARRAYMEQQFSKNGIGADGRPRDPKFVSFS